MDGWRESMESMLSARRYEDDDDDNDDDDDDDDGNDDVCLMCSSVNAISIRSFMNWN